MEDEAISFSEEGRRFSDESSRRTPLGSPTEAAANKNMLNAAIVNSHLKGIPEAPRSTNAFRLPVKMSDVKKAGITPPRLLHP